MNISTIVTETVQWGLYLPVRAATEVAEEVRAIYQIVALDPLRTITYTALAIVAFSTGIFLAVIAVIFEQYALALIAFVVSEAFGVYALKYAGNKINEYRNAQYLKEHSIDKFHNQEIMLVLEDTDKLFTKDWGGPIKEISKQTPTAIAKMSLHTDIAKSITKAKVQNNKIKCLWIRAHGTPTSLGIGKEDYLSKKDVEWLKPWLEALEPDAVIVLEACSTAGKAKKGKNIAQKIAQVAQRKVIAASEIVRHSAIKVIDPKKFDIKFETPRFARYDGNVFDTIIDILSFFSYLCFPTIRQFRRDITAVILPTPIPKVMPIPKPLSLCSRVKRFFGAAAAA